MEKNIFALLAKKKSLVVSVALAFTLCLSAVFFSACKPEEPDNPTPPGPPPAATTYVVSFESNGGSAVQSVTVEENTQLSLDNYVTTKQDNYFYGWCFDETFTQRAPAVITVTADVKLYAEWGAEELYWLHFETGLGSDIESVQYAPNAYLAIPEEPTRENYSFGGWYKNQEYTREFTFFGAQMPNNNLTVYAKWNTLHGIMFDSNGGSEVDSIFGETGEAIVAPVAPTKDGYIFDGWYKDAALTESYEITTVPNNVITVYAKWREQITDIEVTLHLNHFAVEETTITVTGNEGEALNVGTAVDTFLAAVTNAVKDEYLGSASDLTDKPIYNFSAWAYDAKGSQRFDGKLPHSATVDLYAVWSRSSAYCKVSFVGETESYFVKKNTAIPAATIDPVLDGAKAEYEAKGCTVDGFYTVGGNRYQKNDLVAMDLELIPYVYSANLVYTSTTKTNGKGSNVSGYALTGYADSVKDEYKAKDGLLLIVPEYYNNKPVIWVNDNAFADFPVSEVTLPSGTFGIGVQAFKNTKLTAISLPSSLYYLGDNAFSGSTTLADVQLAGEISQLGVTVFDGTAYETAMVTDANGFKYFNAEKTIVYRYVGTGTQVSTPGSAVTIGGGAFKNNTTLKTLTLHDNVRYVSDYAFENTALQTVKIGKFFANMGKGIFKNSTALTSVEFVSKYNLSYLGESMFEGCASLSAINVAELQNLQSVYDNAFKGCTSLKGVKFNDTLVQVGVSAFEGCTSLVYADFGTGDACQLSKLSNRAFANCTSLRRIILRGELKNNTQTVTFGTNVLTGSGYTKNSVFTTPVIYVKDKWVDNWSVDDDFKTASYVQIYENKFKNTEYKNIVIKAIDSQVPTLTINGDVVLSVSGTPNVSAFDLLDFLTTEGVYTVSDNVSYAEDCEVSIKSVVNTMGGTLNSSNGKYNLSAVGQYLVTLVAEDECGNVAEAQFVLTVNS